MCLPESGLGGNEKEPCCAVTTSYFLLLIFNPWNTIQWRMGVWLGLKEVMHFMLFFYVCTWHLLKIKNYWLGKSSFAIINDSLLLFIGMTMLLYLNGSGSGIIFRHSACFIPHNLFACCLLYSFQSKAPALGSYSFVFHTFVSLPYAVWVGVSVPLWFACVSHFGANFVPTFHRPSELLSRDSLNDRTPYDTNVPTRMQGITNEAADIQYWCKISLLYRSVSHPSPHLCVCVCLILSCTLSLTFALASASQSVLRTLQCSGPVFRNHFNPCTLVPCLYHKLVTTNPYLLYIFITPCSSNTSCHTFFVSISLSLSGNLHFSTFVHFLWTWHLTACNWDLLLNACSINSLLKLPIPVTWKKNHNGSIRQLNMVDHDWWWEVLFLLHFFLLWNQGVGWSPIVHGSIVRTNYPMQSDFIYFEMVT